MGTNCTRNFALRSRSGLFTNTTNSLVVIGVVSCFAVTGFAIAATGAGAALSAQPDIVSVNRTHKSDRLSLMSKSTAPVSSAVTALSRPPIGCESAFSRVADPARAHIFGRCVS
jgi:hypothetical protein